MQAASGATAALVRANKETIMYGQRSYLRYCLLAVVLFACYALSIRSQDDNSATLAPNLVFSR
jgi:hypothetical protein